MTICDIKSNPLQYAAEALAAKENRARTGYSEKVLLDILKLRYK